MHEHIWHISMAKQGPERRDAIICKALCESPQTLEIYLLAAHLRICHIVQILSLKPRTGAMAVLAGAMAGPPAAVARLRLWPLHRRTPQRY